ncbi:hypothetical protein [Agrococcus sp. Ld7]|uniref:hypothetical protein n=1 Tax=Agrococcus sp. Ld7 TaxID=649148 RepID=UPI003868CCC0
MHRAAETTLRAVGSRWTTALILLWFGLGAAWIALTARMGMVFDEEWHLDSIAVHAQHGAPWFSTDAPQESVGATSRSSSYLYHYLLSFPERWMADAGAAEFDRVIVLRLLTVAMHVGALLCMVAAVRAAGVSGTVANLAAVAYAALPVSPFLAAQVNYDSAMLLLVAACGWVVVRQWAGQTTWLGMIGAIALGLAAVLTKFHAAPIVLVMLAFVALAVIRDRKLPVLPANRAGRVMLGAVAVVALVLVALSVERFIGNIVTYGSPSPDCAAVLNELRCESYGVWERNREADAAFADLPLSLSTMTQFLFDEWVPRLMVYLQAVWYWFAAPVVSTLVSVAIPVAVISVIAVAAVVWPTAPRLRALLPLVLSSVVYLAILFWHNFGDWRAFGAPLGVQGRYLLPAVVPITALAMHGAADSLRRARFGATLLAVTAIAMLLVATQGGAAAFVISAQPGWYQPGGPLEHLTDNVFRIVDVFVGAVAVPSI